MSGKTVERWIADEELIPHARNRVDASEVLGVDAEMLWPKAVRDRLKTGGDRRPELRLQVGLPLNGLG